MRVIELAKRSATAPHVIRYYERLGLLKAERDPHNGYRCFQRSDVERVRLIRRSRALGLALKDIKTILTDLDAGRQADRRVEALVRAREADLREQMRDLESLHERLCWALKTWSRMNNGASAAGQPCSLIAALPELDHYDTACATARGSTSRDQPDTITQRELI